MNGGKLKIRKKIVYFLPIVQNMAFYGKQSEILWKKFEQFLGKMLIWNTKMQSVHENLRAPEKHSNWKFLEISVNICNSLFVFF